VYDVFLIGPAGPRPRAHARVAFAYKALVVRQYFTPAHARASASRGPRERGEHGEGHEGGRVEGEAGILSFAAGASARARALALALARNCSSRLRARTLARNGRNIVRLCLHLMRRPTGYTGHICGRCRMYVRLLGPLLSISPTYDRAPIRT